MFNIIIKDINGEFKDDIIEERKHIDIQLGEVFTKVKVTSGTIVRDSTTADPYQSIFSLVVDDVHFFLLRCQAFEEDKIKFGFSALSFPNNEGGLLLQLNKKINLNYFKYRDQFAPFGGVSMTDKEFFILAFTTIGDNQGIHRVHKDDEPPLQFRYKQGVFLSLEPPSLNKTSCTLVDHSSFDILTRGMVVGTRILNDNMFTNLIHHSDAESYMNDVVESDFLNPANSIEPWTSETDASYVPILRK